MKLSVIIVNYRVKFFTLQLLDSLNKALAGIENEIIVVDNNSGDDSVVFLGSYFPDVIYVSNTENEGFAKANNKAISMSGSEYVLLINPDTFVDEKLIGEVLEFMDGNIDCGCCGVKLTDSFGNYLAESKRSFPSVRLSFYKLFGLSTLFPKSRTFSGYSLGYLDENMINQVEILPGAFMMIRRDALMKTGGFDESFFMYGEDIDLSYRLDKSGYKNYFLPYPLIHYKGESSRQDNKKYIYSFYNAMEVFVRKYNKSAFQVLPLVFSIRLLRKVALIGSSLKSVLKKIGLRKNIRLMRILIPAELRDDNRIGDFFLSENVEVNVVFDVYNYVEEMEEKLENESCNCVLVFSDSYSDITNWIIGSPKNISFYIYNRDTNIIVSSEKCAIIKI